MRVDVSQLKTRVASRRLFCRMLNLYGPTPTESNEITFRMAMEAHMTVLQEISDATLSTDHLCNWLDLILVLWRDAPWVSGSHFAPSSC